MIEYVWQHGLEGEAERLRLMSEILDPSGRDHLSRLPIGENWSCIEIGAGNGSLSQWLATRLGPDGRAIATDIAPNLMAGIAKDNLEVRRLDVVKDGLDENAYDLVMIRALLHHLPERMDVIATMVRALRREVGNVVLLGSHKNGDQRRFVCQSATGAVSFPLSFICL